ncbi:ABC transporter substrate-binding protein [Candidatus Poriferisocius sp.]|uniref:ABC transporter substrate-binding protein n=1 Tax=Candidatus Poriferisocius sp. TaxID=3101276 RepID=UPI003B0257CC
MRSWLLKLLALLMVFGLVAAACGNDDDDGVATGPDEPASAEPASEGGGDEPAPAPSDDGDDGAAPAPSDDGDDGAAPAPSDDGDDGAEDEMMGACAATVSGTKVNYAVFSPNANMDPTASSGALVGGTQLVNVWDVLMTFDPESGLYSGQAAESLTPNDDFTEWTLKIRSGITYGNGDAFVAQDVVDSMLRYFDSRGDGMTNRAAGSVGLIDFDNTEVPDDSTVIFRLSRAWSTFPSLLGDEPGMVVNPRIIAQLLDEEAGNATEETSAAKLVRNRMAVSPDLVNAASFGPYVVAEVEPNVRTVLQARDSYWGGPVCIEEIEFTFPGSSVANWEAFQAGDFNAAFLRDPRVFAEAREAGTVLSSEFQNLGGLFLFNHGVRGADSMGADLRVRQAAHHAINRDIINERAFEGKLNTTNGVAAEGTLLWSPELQECADQEPAYDPDAASALVEEVKAETGWDGSLFLVHADTDPGPEIAQAVEGMLEAVGFDVEVALGPVTTVLIPRVIIQADYEMAGWGFNADGATWVASLNDNLLSTSGSNRMAFASADMDDALGAMYGAETVEDQRAALAAVQCVWKDELPAMIYSVTEEGLAMADNLKGVQRAGATIFLFGNAYIEN